MNRQERAKELQARIDKATDELSYQLASGMPERFRELLEFYAQHFRSYSVNNTWLIRMQCPAASYVAGMKKWNELGYRIRKGEHAIWILAPRFRKQTDADGKETTRLIGFVSVPVYDSTQVEGEGQIPPIRLPVEHDFEEVYTWLEARIPLELGMEVNHKPLGPAMGGYATKDEIVINSSHNLSQRFPTLIHETAHAILRHHENDIPRTQRELEAEATAFVLLKVIGFESEASVGYIKNWRGSPEQLQKSLSAIHFAVTTLYGWIEECLIAEEELKEQGLIA